MDRLLSEWQRLFLHPGAPDDAPPAARLAGPDGSVRCAVLSLSGPEGWAALPALWRGVQEALGLPAPAIAVDGAGAGQLWFAFGPPQAAVEATRLLAGLCQRWAADVPAHRLQTWPAATGTEAPLPALPPMQRGPERWAAFLAPDLAVLFADEPWLDQPPGAEAQADLLSRLVPATAPELAQALAQLRPAAPGHALVARPQAQPLALPAAGLPTLETAVGPGVQAEAESADPARFLTAVMQDAAVPLALRVEAAKALLAARDG